MSASARGPSQCRRHRCTYLVGAKPLDQFALQCFESLPQPGMFVNIHLRVRDARFDTLHRASLGRIRSTLSPKSSGKLSSVMGSCNYLKGYTIRNAEAYVKPVKPVCKHSVNPCSTYRDRADAKSLRRG